jgi:glucose/arabinose dehydrogenase
MGKGAMNILMLVLSGLTLSGCSDTTEPGAGDDVTPDTGLAVVVVEGDFDAPVFLTAPPGDPRLFVVEQRGRIWIIQDGQRLATPFLDIDDIVRSGGERGLLSMAFHPSYAANGSFYVSYTSEPDGDTRIERYRVSSDPNVAQPDGDRVIFELDQPFGNHNGGLIAFGPDGMLYIGMGDGGSGGDPRGHGQNKSSLLGALLRIDVDGGDPYAIPPDNPFVGIDGGDEVWAYGLRNPWRFSFDREGGSLYIADVGQNAWEEVNAVDSDASGINYGWNRTEGRHCFDASSCATDGLTLPVLEYGHGQGCSVTGGYVYRGAAIPAIRGHYFYSDYCSGFLRSFRLNGSAAIDQREWEVGDLGRVLSFGEDSNGELYILSSNGNVYRLVAAE